MSVLKSAWSVVARRALADKALLLAAAAAILVATMLVAAGPIYADSVTVSAARASLARAELRDVNIQLSARVDSGSIDETAAVVGQELDAALAEIGYASAFRITSDSYQLPEGLGGSPTTLAVFRWYDDHLAHTTLLEGEWPVAGGDPIQVAIPGEVGASLGIGRGDSLDLINRRAEGPTVSVLIVGTYQVDDPSDPYWYEDDLDSTGVEEGVGFTTWGPFLVGRDDLLGPISPLNAGMDWRFYPNHELIELPQLTALRDDLAALPTSLNTGRGAGNRIIVDTGLGEILDQVDRSLLVTRSTLLVMTLQFALLAGYALFLTAGVLAESRQLGTYLLRARGATNYQALAMGAMEGALLVIPAIVAGPPLAALALRVFNRAGPLSDIGLTIAPAPTAGAYVVAVVVGLGCLAAISIPSYRSARSFAGVRARRSRQSGLGLAQRAWVDLSLLGVAALALWQLKRYGAPLTRTVGGALGVDPLLVAAPALGLFAGGLVALRSVPLISAAAEKVMAQGGSVVPALGAWQVSRRPRRYSRTALLLTFAIAIGFVALAYGRTWRASQGDQAAFQVGSDLVAHRDRVLDSTIPWLVASDAYRDLPGFEAATPVLFESGRLSRNSSRARFVMVDAERAADTVLFRPDLADSSLDDLMSRLAEGRFGLPGFSLRGEPARLAIEASFELEAFPVDLEVPDQIHESRLTLNPDLRILLTDADGNVFRISAGGLPEGQATRLVVGLDETLEDGRRLLPAYPLSLAGFEIRFEVPIEFVREASVSVTSLEVSANSSGGGWEDAGIDLERSAWQATVPDARRVFVQPSATLGRAEDGLQVFVASGSMGFDSPVTAFVGLTPAGGPVDAPLPLLLSSGLLEDLRLEVGDEAPLDTLPGIDGVGRIVGVIDEFPTVDDLSEPVVLDLQTYLAARYRPGSSVPYPDEVWIAADDALIDSGRQALLAAPYSTGQVTSRIDEELILASDPEAIGTVGSLMLGFVAAGVLAAVGFGVNASVSARERLLEFGLLRASGLSRRQLWGWLTVESLVVVVFSFIIGTVLGAVLASLVLPLTTVTQAGARVLPDPIVVNPWMTILVFEAVILVALLLVAGWLTLSLRRRGLGTLLRIGEE
jgi:hypothetical protein